MPKMEKQKSDFSKNVHGYVSYIENIVYHVVYYLHIAFIIFKMYFETGCFLVSCLLLNEEEYLW